MRKKYDFEFKLKIVKENEAGLGRGYLSKKYDVSDSTIRNWITAYRRHGEDGLKGKNPNTNYSGDFKFYVLQYRKEHGLSYNETAEHFDLWSGSNVERWQYTYNEKGISGLYKSVGRPKKSGESNMNNKKKNKDKNPSELTAEDIRILKEENMMLRAEVEYLKKLEALIQQKELQTKKKQ